MREALAVKKIKPSDARAELGLTQRELAALAGLTQSTIYKVEAGLSISRITAHALFKALNKERAAQGLHRLEFDRIDWKIQGSKGD